MRSRALLEFGAMNATRRAFVPALAALALLAAAFPSSCATRRPAEAAPRAESAQRGGGDASALPDLEPASLLSNAIAKAPAVTVEAYPDADEVSLFEWEETRYGTNGNYTTTWTSLSKILTQRGLEGNRTFSFSNNDFYGSTTVLVARVHSPDGTARDVDLAANLAEAVDTGSLASNIHDPNDKTFTLAFPELAVGDAVEVSMRRVAKRPRCEGVYADYLTFESDHPILFQGVRITGPASMPLRSRAFRDAGPVSLEHAASTNEEAGTITEVWTAGETPRYFAEPDMPPAYDCTARLLLSTAPDWESLSRWYARLCAPHLAATNDAMRAKVDELLRTALSAPPAAGSDRLLDDSRAKSAEAEAADRRAFRELNPEFRLDELDELWCWIVDLRLQEARLRREVLRLWGEVLGPGETVEKAERDVREATDAAHRDEGNSLSNRLEALPESERDSFLEDVWVERRAEIRRLQGAIVDLNQRLEVFVVEADPHEEAAEAADDGGASSPSEPQDRAPRDRAPRADESDPAEWANAVFVGYEFLSSLESKNPGPLALDPDEALKRRLGEFGVGWPAGSFVRIFPESGAFAVCNSRSNLDILSLALGDASPEPRVLEIDRETPIHPWWFFGGDGPEAVSRRKLALWRDADFFGWEDSEDAADSIETLVEKVLRADTVLRRVRREEATFRSEVFRLCVSGKPAGRAERALRDYESAKQEAQADDEDARRDSLMWHIEDRPETNRLDFVSSLLDERLSDIRELIPQIGLWRWQISLLTNAGPDGLKQAPASAEGLAPAVRAAASALGTGTRVLLPEPRNGEGVAQFGCAGGPHGFLDDDGLYIIRKEFARAGIPLVAGPSVDGFFRPPNLSEEYERRIAWGNAHSDAILGGTLDPPNLHDPVPIGRRFDLATPDGSLAVEFLSRDDHRELEQEEPKDPAELGVLSTGEDFDFPLRMSRYAETLRARRDGRPLLVAVFFEPFGPDPAFALRLQVRKVLAALRSESAPRAAQGEPANAGEAGLEPANLRTRAERPPRAQREAVVRALFDFVSREVRYMGAMAESEAPGYEPHDVSLTFDNRYGVCRDKAALLVAMLRMAGIDAWPVLINVGPRKDPQVPQPYFNHAIVAADSGDPADPYLLMDPTSETTRSLLPEYLCEMSYLVARDEGEGIRETPPLPVEQNLLRAETVYTLHADASADVTTTLSFAGVNDAAYRGYFASIPRDGLRAFFERVLQGIPGAVLTGWEVRPAPEALRTSAEPLSVRLDYAIAEAARGAEDGRAALLDLPTVPAALAIASRVVGDLGLEKRRFPLVTDYPCGWEETVEIRLPDGVALSPESAAERKPE